MKSKVLVLSLAMALLTQAKAAPNCAELFKEINPPKFTTIRMKPDTNQIPFEKVGSYLVGNRAIIINKSNVVSGTMVFDNKTKTLRPLSEIFTKDDIKPPYNLEGEGSYLLSTDQKFLVRKTFHEYDVFDLSRDKIVAKYLYDFSADPRLRSAVMKDENLGFMTALYAGTTTGNLSIDVIGKSNKVERREYLYMKENYSNAFLTDKFLYGFSYDGGKIFVKDLSTGSQKEVSTSLNRVSTVQSITNQKDGTVLIDAYSGASLLDKNNNEIRAVNYENLIPSRQMKGNDAFDSHFAVIGTKTDYSNDTGFVIYIGDLKTGKVSKAISVTDSKASSSYPPKIQLGKDGLLVVKTSSKLLAFDKNGNLVSEDPLTQQEMDRSGLIRVGDRSFLIHVSGDSVRAVDFN
jgi:hypothetical protein